MVHLFAKVNLGAYLSRFSHSCIGEKKGTNGCLDRWYNLLLWMMKTWITLWKRIGWKSNPTCHLSTYDGRCFAFLKKVLMIAWKMRRNFIAFRISNFIDTRLKFEIVLTQFRLVVQELLKDSTIVVYYRFNEIKTKTLREILMTSWSC